MRFNFQCGKFGACVSLILGFFSVSAAAQSALEVQAPASALACLQTHAGENAKPIYPADELTMLVAAKVRVQLTFRSSDSSPKVKVLTNTDTEVFARAVEDFVQRYRLPCFVSGSLPAVAIQDFAFEPGDGRKVFYGAVTDEAPGKMDIACFVRPSDQPRYPVRAIDAGEAGTILAEVSFRGVNTEPSVRIIYGARSETLSASVERHMKSYRLVCPMPGAEPITATQTFIFRMTDKDRYALKDMNLVRFLKLVVPADLANANFNLNTMGCPFDVSVRVRRPHADNLVGEYGETDLRRQDFLKWVRGLSLNLPADLEPYLFDQKVKVSVPCLVLSL